MLTTRERVLAVLDETADSIEHLHDSALREIVPVLERAQHEVQRDLRLWLSKENGADTFTAQRLRNATIVLNRALKAADDLGDITEGALKSSHERISGLALHNLQREWKAFGTIFEGTIQPLAIDQAVVIATGRSLMWPRFETSAARYAGTIGDRLRLELAVSRTRSETMDELTRRLLTKMPDIFEGERWSAERLARTETMASYNFTAIEGIHEAKAEDPELVIRWDSAHDFRRCPACGSLDGKTVKPGEKFTAVWTTISKRTGKLRQHSITVDAAPLHPLCRCSCGAWRESWAKYSRRDEVSYQQAA
jgi:hypothetical protein